LSSSRAHTRTKRDWIADLLYRYARKLGWSSVWFRETDKMFSTSVVAPAWAQLPSARAPSPRAGAPSSRFRLMGRRPRGGRSARDGITWLPPCNERRWGVVLEAVSAPSTLSAH